MKETKNTEIKVGFFVLLGALAIVFSIFVLSGDQAMFEEQYHVKVKFQEATGLTAGSVVAVMGFPVGNVEHIDFEEKSLELDVTMKIYERYRDKITEGSIADVRTKGALGDKYIYITPKSGSTPVADYGYIEASKEQDLLSVISSKGHQIDKVFSIITKLDLLLDDLNGQGQAKELMNGLKDTALQLKSVSANLNSISKDLKSDDAGKSIAQSLQHLNNVLEKIDNGEGSLGALINDPSLHNSLKRILGAKNYNNTLKGVIRSSIKESEE
jgi:phospholipid/cholesterol/gamma-HCH transport system substrate-binding protein